MGQIFLVVRIGGQVFSEELLGQLRARIAAEPKVSRRALSRWLCQRLDWKSRNGAYQHMAARLALNKLARRQCIELPRAAKPIQRRRPRTVAHPAVEVRCSLGELGAVELVRVTARQRLLSGLWNSFIAEHHPLGYQPMVGAQVRYLIQNRRGWLGAIGFGAAAWSLRDRDRYIGWSGSARRLNLSKVACNWRFLILPTVVVPHLASRVLSQCARQLPAEWERSYGYRPVLLETFVESGRYQGRCYRGANWQRIGRSQGRGRNDRAHRCARKPKDIYVYPLVKNWKSQLCAEPEVVPPVVVVPEHPALEWTQEEFGSAPVPDRRLRQRLRTMALDFFRQPEASIPQACGSRAKTKAAYRLLNHEGLSMEGILRGHQAATLIRMAGQSVVLAVQDSTAVTYGNRPASTGLGVTNNDENTQVGFWLHHTMAYSLEGLALGLLDVQVWARPEPLQRPRHRRGHCPIQEKESHKWLQSFSTTALAQRRLPRTQIVSVADREADLYELFVEARDRGQGAKLLIRVQHQHRRLAQEQGHLLEQLRQKERAGVTEVNVGRRGPQRTRRARLQVRFGRVLLKPPAGKAHLGPVEAWAVLATETQAPCGIKPIQWMLLSTLAVETLEQAAEKLRWYAIRSLIEGFHRTIKSGCRIEKRQLIAAESLKRCLAIDLIVGWRIMHMSRLGRQQPELPCTEVFEENEWKALHCFVHETLRLPKKPPGLQPTVRMVASLGGFLGRKGDGQPGAQTLWLGLHRLHDITAAWDLFWRLQQRTRGP